MKRQFINLVCWMLLAATTLSCKKAYDEYNLDPLAASYADIPVTVTNYNVFERFPTIFATAPSGTFSVTFSIPSDKGTIKEITRVATGSNGIALLQTGTASQQLNYSAATGTTTVTPGNATNTITFQSSLTDYTTYRTRVGTGAGSAATVSTNAQAPTQLLYYFLLTLTTPRGDVQVIPTQVRIRVI